MNAVTGQELHVTVINETDAVQVDHGQVGSVRLDLAYVDHLVDFFLLFVSKFKSSCIKQTWIPTLVSVTQKKYWLLGTQPLL